MSQVNQEKTINVELNERNDADYLTFNFNTPLSVNLNSSESQEELKAVFACLLRELMNQPIKLEFQVKDKYPRQLYKDVCTEYIDTLNKELVILAKKAPRA